MLPPKRPPGLRPRRAGVVRWLDRHAHPDSRAWRYLHLAQALVGVLGVVGLLAVAAQLRETNEAAKRDAHGRSVDAAAQISQALLDRPGIQCALHPDSPYGRLDRDARDAVQFIGLNLDLHERLWREHGAGVYGDEDWQDWDRWFRDEFVASDLFLAVWSDQRPYYHDDFVRYVDGLVEAEVAGRATATVAAGGAPYAAPTLADYAAPAAATPAC